MTGKNEFIADSREILEGLREALGKLDRTITAARQHADKLKARRRETLEAHVDRLLPDLELGTLQGLRSIRGLDTSNLEPTFTDAHNVHVSLWSRLTGEAHERRLEAYASEFKLMRIQLTSFIDRDKANRQFDDLRELSENISEAKSDLADLERKREALQADFDKAQQTHRTVSESSGKKISPLVLQQVSTNAKRLREARRQQSAMPPTRVSEQSRDEDNTDWLLLWAFDMPTSGRTLIADMVFHDHHSHSSEPVQQDFGGGGGFSGAGASGSWDDKTPPEPVPSRDPDTNTEAVIATDDSLGRYS